MKIGDGQPSPVAVDSALHKEMYLDRDSGFWQNMHELLWDGSLMFRPEK